MGRGAESRNTGPGNTWEPMADYYPLISKAVAGLDKNTGETRRALYERARQALVAQLRGVEPALSESDITRERLGLEEAIRKVEAEAARQARETMRPGVTRRPDLPRPPEPVRPPARAPTLPTPPPPQRATPVAFPPIPADEPQSARPQQPQFQPQRPPAPVRRSVQDEGVQRFRDTPSYRDTPDQVTPAPPPTRPMPPSDPFVSRAAPTAPPHQPSEPERHPLEEYGQLEPQVEPENLWALPLDAQHAEPPVDLDANRAAAEQEAEQHHQEVEDREPPPRHRPRRSYAGLIRLVLALVLLGIIVGLGVWQRHTIVDVASGVMSVFRSTPTVAPPKEAAAPPARPKIADRIGQPSPGAAPGAAPAAGPPVAQRVVLYEEEPDDPQGKRFVGTVLWKTEMRPASPGRPPELAVRADVEVPERKMSITFSFRRNTDASLPASHTVEIVFTLPADTPSGGVQKVPGVLMKQAEQTRGVPLAGLAVPVTPGYFLIGLSSVESDMQRNLQLLKERGWFDIPIIYNNNRRAILAIEKGTPGEQAFNAAFAAWKQ